MLKRLVVHLDSGTARQHELEVADDAAYLDEVNKTIVSLTREGKGVLLFTTPSLGIYRLRDIVGIEFLDPLPPDKQPSMGFRPPSE